LNDQLGLITAAKKGDRDAFLGLIEPLEDKLYQTALGIVGNRHDAEDVWQNTALKAWKNISGLREPVFRTWITRILLNEAKMLLRSKSYAPIPQEQLPETGVTDTDISTKLLVHNCLRHLTPEHRQAVMLRFWLDLTLEDIAGVMQVPLGTAKTRLYHGLENLKRRLKEAELA